MRPVALVMAGGRARRLGGLEKPLLEVCGRPMVVSVIEAAAEALGYVIVAAGRQLLSKLRSSANGPYLDMVESPGLGYAEDLALVARSLRTRPLIVLPADVPYVSWVLVSELARMAMASECVVTIVACSRYLGVSALGRRLDCWYDLALRCCRELLDVDTFGDLAEAQVACYDIPRSRR